MSRRLTLDILVNPKADRGKVRAEARALDAILGSIGVNAVDMIDSAGLDRAFADAEKGAAELADALDAAAAEGIKDAHRLAAEIANIGGVASGLNIPPIEIPRPTIPEPDPPHIPDIPAPEVPPPDVSALADAFDDLVAKLRKLNQQQASALAQLAAEGKEGTEEWKHVRAELGKTTEQLAELEGHVENLKKGKFNFMEAFFAGEALQGIGEQLQQMEAKAKASAEALRQVQAQTGATAEQMTVLKARATDAFVSGVGESVDEAIRAVGAAQQQLGQFLNPQEIDAFLVKAAGISKVFGTEIPETVGKARTFIQNFKTSGTEAGDLIALTMRDAANGMGDVLDTTDEYSQHAAKAGFSAEEFTGRLIAGVQAGTRDTDKLGDAIKEAQIRLNAGDTATALAGIAGPVSATIQGIAAAAQKGEITVAQMLQQSAQAIQTAFDAGEITDAMRSQLQVAVAGTPAEDIGADLYSKVFAAPIDTNAIKAKAAQAGAAMEQAIAPTNVFESLARSADAFATDAAILFQPFIAGAGTAIQTVGQIGPGLALLQDKFKIFDVAGGLVKKLTAALFASVPAIGAEAIATEGAAVAQVGLNAAQLAMPILAIVAGAGAIVAAFIVFGNQTKGLREAIDDVNAKLDDYTAAAERANEVSKASDGLAKLADEYDKLAAKPARTAAEEKRFIEVSDELAAQAPGYAESISGIGDSAAATGQKFAIATDGVREFARANKELAAEQAADQLEALQSDAAALVESYHASTEELAKLKSKRKELSETTKGEADLGTKDVHDSIAKIVPLMDTYGEQQASINKDIAEESKKRVEAQATIQKAVVAMQKAGKSQADIQAALGLSNEELRKFSPEMKKAGDSAAGAAGKTQGLASAAARAKTTVADLAAAYDKVRSAADAAYGNTFKAALALKTEQRTAAAELARLNARPLESLTEEETKRKAFLQQRLKDLPKEIADEINAARAALKDKRLLDAEETRLKLSVGEINFDVTDFTQQARDIRREIGDILFEVANSTQQDLTKQAIDAIEQKLKDDIAALEVQKKAAAEQARKIANDNNPATVVKGLGELNAALDAKAAALKRQAEADKKKAADDVRKQIIEQFAKLLADQDRLMTAGLKAQVEELNRAADAITANDQDAIDERLAKRLQAIEINQALELHALVSGNEKYLQAYGELQIELRKIQDATSADAVAAAQKRAAELRVSLAKIEKDIVTSSTESLAIQAATQAEINKVIADANDARFQREMAELQRQQERKLALYERDAERQMQLIEDVATFSETHLGSLVDAQAAQRQKDLDREREEKLKALGDQEGEKARVEQEFADRAAKQQADADSKRNALAAHANAVRVEAERQAAIASLALQRSQLDEQLKLAQAAGKLDQAADIQKQLDDISLAIEDKGSVLTGLTVELQSDVTDVLSNLFAGNTEQVKTGFRKPFAALAGALEQLAAAKVTEVLLGSIIGAGGIAGLLAALLGRPLISTIIGAFMKPVLSGLLSFSTGGRVDAPTLAIVGDAARQGGSNREWIFRDEQLGALLSEVSARQQNALTSELRAVRATLEEGNAREWRLQGADITGAVKRTRRQQSRRIINAR